MHTSSGELGYANVARDVRRVADGRRRVVTESGAKQFGFSGQVCLCSGQRIALVATEEKQNGQSLIKAGGIFSSLFKRFTWRMSMNTTKATIRKSNTAFKNTP